MFQERGARSQALVRGVSLHLLRKYERGGILDEVDSTLIASPSVLLFVPARGAFERERRVAARAELRSVGRLATALCAFHILILEERGARFVAPRASAPRLLLSLWPVELSVHEGSGDAARKRLAR